MVANFYKFNHGFCTQNRIKELTNQIGGRLSTRYETKTKSFDKLIQENNNLRSQLEKEKSTIEKLRQNRIRLQVSY